MTLQCRTCGNVIYNMNAKNLFLTENADVLMNIEIVAGTALKKCPELPSHICGCCLLDLKKAVVHMKVFRERCIKTQQQLLSTKTLVENSSKGDMELKSDYNINQETMSNYEELPIEIDRLEEDFDDDDDEIIDAFEDTISRDKEGPTEDADCVIASAQNEMHSICELSSDSQETIEELQKFSDNESIQNISSCSDISKSISIRVSPPTTFTDHPLNNDYSNGDSNKKILKKNLNRNNLNCKTITVKTKKTYISWKNLTEEQIIARRRKQRLRDCICDQCGRHFTDQSNFKLHMLRHSGIKNFKCKECSKLFYTDHLLQLHERTVHRGERPYACKYCDKTFNSSTTRVMHERSHTNVRPYSCEYCDKSFISASALKRHDLTHNGVRAFYCSICDKTFQRNTHLKAHLRSKLHEMNERRQY
ncbi:PREDICTED: zinc finger protein 510 [Drosophila arizonae]|uniref:Zinc finger protein 510 n=1 Tax=Drosophila arizonae TaxID=7263 RepID=A0ABM1PY03_DROAR|nr:PREDICTED: zinc finger protein 510 [Drosophila arizonae]